jgi:hypothetical protein
MPVLTFSRYFPAYHKRKGESTYFMEKIWSGLADSTDMVMDNIDFSKVDFDFHAYYNGVPKWHTIRQGNRWKVGDRFSPRAWNGEPYKTKQTTFAPDVEIKQLWDIKIVTEDDDGENDWSYIVLNGKSYTVYSDEYLSPVIKKLALNDGLSTTDMFDWFKLQRTNKQIRNKESKIFEGQVICWSDKIQYP